MGMKITPIPARLSVIYFTHRAILVASQFVQPPQSERANWAQECDFAWYWDEYVYDEDVLRLGMGHWDEEMNRTSTVFLYQSMKRGNTLLPSVKRWPGRDCVRFHSRNLR
ncbi:hypothetical protein MNBD_CHLOROFLEXI01-4606 [hydrothermal vent metagenome]|uniref:Uncharacterized protein n=1 Tax=hydrothermal vent metagenome TaxID=652676 RepID=A0A3B0V2W3_9ZZZZ